MRQKLKRQFLFKTKPIGRIDFLNTLNSGQIFLWKEFGEKFCVINGDNVIRIDKISTKISSYRKTKWDYFRNSDNFEKILKEISKDKIVNQAIKKSPGLRILRQDPFQCYISFIVSANSNIHNIKSALTNLCEKFGEKIQFENEEFFLFPKPKTLASAKITDLLNCGLGYRAKAVKLASKHVDSGKIDFELLKKSDYYTAKNCLLEVYGIGDKVADCIMLFSLEKLESFPLDTWMIKVLKKYYSNNFDLTQQSLTKKKYNELHEKIVNYFGRHAGYSQQFLFKMERDLNQKSWS